MSELQRSAESRAGEAASRHEKDQARNAQQQLLLQMISTVRMFGIEVWRVRGLTGSSPQNPAWAKRLADAKEPKAELDRILREMKELQHAGGAKREP